MSEFTYNLSTDFIVGVDQEQLDNEIKEVISTDFYIRMKGSEVKIMFNSGLSASDQSLLADVISSHDPTAFPQPLSIDRSIKNGEIYIANHFPDPSYERRSSINEETTDTFMDQSFTFTNDYSGDYTIDNPLIAELNENSFILTGTSYVEGNNVSGDGTAYASSEQQPASYAIDNNTNTFWYNTSASGAVGSWWMIDFGTVKGIYSFEAVWYSTTYYGTDVSIQWSNDAENWNLILRDQNVTYTSSGNTTGSYKFADFSQPVFARYFRVLCNASNNSTYFIMREARFFEAVGMGFSTTGNATLENMVPTGQLDTFNWATINSCQLQGTFPTGTTTKILLSFDNKSSWVYWSGSAWISESDISNSTMTPSIFNGLTAADFAATDGLNSDSSNTLDIKIYISTTDSSKSPIISCIQFNVTTNIYREQVSDSAIRVRNISSRKTEFKNISGEERVFHIRIMK